MVKQPLCWYFWVPRLPICHYVTGGRRRRAKNSKSRVQYSLKFVEDDQETSCGCDRGVLVGMAGGCVNFPKSKISKKNSKLQSLKNSKNPKTKPHSMSDVSLVGVAGVSLGVALGMASGCVNFQNSQKSKNLKKNICHQKAYCMSDVSLCFHV